MNTLEFELHELVKDFCECVTQANELYHYNFGWHGNGASDAYLDLQDEAAELAERITALVKSASESPEDVTEEPLLAIVQKMVAWQRVNP